MKPALWLLLPLLAGCVVERNVQCPIQAIADRAIDRQVTLEQLLSSDAECDSGQLTEAYQAALEQRCLPRRGWQDGLAGEPAYPHCQDRRAWREAYNLGGSYAAFQSELERLDRQIQQEGQAGGQARMQRVRVVRELDAITGAARLNGWIEAGDGS
ncbi:MAG: hypothetical protein QNJ40_17515 [Xanthomonadales bacterium]|nr:hypothetical protein [Xanthomonadales bacterium]